MLINVRDGQKWASIPHLHKDLLKKLLTASGLHAWGAFLKTYCVYQGFLYIECQNTISYIECIMSYQTCFLYTINKSDATRIWWWVTVDMLSFWVGTNVECHIIMLLLCVWNMESIRSQLWGKTDQNKVINLIFTPDYFTTHLLPEPVQITAQGHGSLLERERRISKLSASCRKLNNLPLKKLFFYVTDVAIN